MGSVWSKAKQGVRNVNVYHRAHKVISQEKPTIAPRHPKSQEKIDKLLTENPQIINEQQKKDDKLLEKLKDVKVESFGPPPEIKSSRKLPETRTQIKDSEYGVFEPENIPVGKATLRNFHSMLIEYKVSPGEATLSRLSEQHKIDKETLNQVLIHFRAMDLNIPEKYLRKDKTVLDAFKKHNILPLDKKDSVSERLKLTPGFNKASASEDQGEK